MFVFWKNKNSEAVFQNNFFQRTNHQFFKTKYKQTSPRIKIKIKPTETKKKEKEVESKRQTHDEERSVVSQISSTNDCGSRFLKPLIEKYIMEKNFSCLNIKSEKGKWIT